MRFAVGAMLFEGNTFSPVIARRADFASRIRGGYTAYKIRTAVEIGQVTGHQGPLGIGASTRNGGMVLPELKAGPRTLAARYGDLGRRMAAHQIGPERTFS